jgi:Zn-dependent protease with chaperone function
MSTPESRATIDFFDHQERARKKTGLLVTYFALAVAAIIILVYVVIAGAFLAAEKQSHPAATGFEWARLWDWQLFAAVSGGTLLLIGGGSAYRTVSLAAGGQKVAEMLGGRLIPSDTTDADERRILNVVEEMAIASGCPVPPVYLLENEAGINAFAAGHNTGDAIIGVTRGCIQTLSRDELQGVIAHEFSHILNGDMRLNIRLIGVLYGILLISITGWIIFRSTQYSAPRRDDDDKKGGNPLPLIGLALYVIGYVGVFFGRLIKAAVSRQREYLADASAVQFTRNPGGIAGALKKIGALQDGSRVRDPETEEASHLFFGEPLGLSEWNPMATHPPLADRIRRIDPSFNGDFSEVSVEPPRSRQQEIELRRMHEEMKRGAASASPRDGGRVPFNPVEAITRVGTLNPQNVAYAAALLDSIPQPLVNGAREPFGACALIYALLLDTQNVEVRTRQLQTLASGDGGAMVTATQQAYSQLAGVSAEARLPLIELAIPALKRLSRSQFERFVTDSRVLMEADRQISLFEYAVRRMLMRHLGPHFGWVRPIEMRYDAPHPLVQPMATLLSALSNVGQTDTAAREAAYRAGVQALGWPEPLPPIFLAEQTNLNAVDAALDTVCAASPRLKKDALAACAACIGADGMITLEEGELLRAVADALDCPMPPLRAPGGPASTQGSRMT